MASGALCLRHDPLMPCIPFVQEPLLFYRCVFDGLEWQRSMYGHVAIRTVLKGFLDNHLTAAAQLMVRSSSGHMAHLPSFSLHCNSQALCYDGKIGVFQSC